MLSPLSITVIKQMHLDTEEQTPQLCVHTHDSSESGTPATSSVAENIDIYLQPVLA